MRVYSDGRVYGATVEQRLLARIDVTESGCWEARGRRSPRGYVDMTIDGKHHRVHRVSYGLFVGPVPDELLVCHKCDNPPCCNPDHLFLGTHKDNALDAGRKGRLSAPGTRGETHPSVTVADSLAAEAIRRYQGGESQRSIAADLGVSQGSVSNWVRGKARSYLIEGAA